MVSVAFCADAPVMVTEGVTAQVAGLVGFAGVIVTAQVRLTAPVKPFAGVTEIVAVLPVVALASKVMGPLFVRAKLDSPRQ
jgi:cell division ATPase FtsA